MRLLQQRMHSLAVIREKPAHSTAGEGDPMAQFAREMASDLHIPLSALSGYLKLSEEKYQGHLDPGAQAFMAHISGEAIRLAAVITGLSAYAEAGRPRDVAPISSETVLGKVLIDLAAQIAREEAKITHDPLPVVLADEEGLARVFANLIENALLFHGSTPPCVHLSARRAEETFLGEQTHHPSESCRPGARRLWRFVIEDNGVGLSEADQARVFDVFYRVPGRGETPGVGIGLALCKKIVQRLGGEIVVASEVGKGSRFIFTLQEGLP